MTKRRDEVEAAVDPVVHYVTAVQATLVPQKALKLIVDVLNDGTKTTKEIIVNL